jgi:hypothetical protein
MTQTDTAPDRLPGPAVAAAVLGLVAAAVAAVVALGLVGLGALTQDGYAAVLWLVGLLAAAVAQGWGAVRLLRRRGWRLLALGSLPGLLPAAALVGVWREYGEGLAVIGTLAALPLLALVLTVLPRVRRWATPRQVVPAGPTPGA